ncbi:DUF2971 domain-containing protein [Enterobacter chuandaensis]|uniref:DUF2971 domain-containing protein n=1 Tax=Enterobacter chuandaensis TaxID=2497875 RepID=UPI001C2E0369|nr:DUF2971 domain-containing protein [Enterobacter chuandaensis]
MILYKFYRPGENFNKAIRYSEIYFSSNKQLNDPNDLKAKYYFEDDKELWSKLLRTEVPIGVKDLAQLLKLDDGILSSGLNDLFKGIKVDANAKSLNKIFEDKKNVTLKLIEKSLRNIDELSDMWYSGLDEPVPFLVENCHAAIKELVFKGIKTEVYSVSFSKTPLEPMMWAHYADGFKGCAIVYQLPDDNLYLTKNIYSDQMFQISMHEVKYHDGEKLIPILQCGLGEQAPIEQALLNKNSFWKYESEMRAFMFRSQRMMLATLSDKYVIPEFEERIFHTHPALIAGVLFGPAFDESKKYLVEFTLRNTKEAKKCKANFFLFDTQLNDNGTIKITQAKECKPSTDPKDYMSELYQERKLQILLDRMGVVQK